MSGVYGGWGRRLLGTCALLALVQLDVPDQVRGQEHAPCFHCELYNLQQRRQRDLMPADQPRDKECHRTCQCPIEELSCMEGVRKVKDGCNCCLMCPRQLGDVCSHVHVCDREKGLYCHLTTDAAGKQYGFCRSKSPKPCTVDGRVYEDNEKFTRGCRERCTCQNGRYGCTSMCPHEAVVPSSSFCPNPILVEIKGRCCKEWSCPREHPETTQALYTNTPPLPTRQCKIEITNWSACSVTCGYGRSVRFSNDNPECRVKEEERLCIIRPCQADGKNDKGKDCKRTFRVTRKEQLEVDGCRSTKLYTLKYCGQCRREKCCIPDKTKTKTLKFSCSNHTQILKNFMWVKSCTCFSLDKCPDAFKHTFR